MAFVARFLAIFPCGIVTMIYLVHDILLIYLVHDIIISCSKSPHSIAIIALSFVTAQRKAPSPLLVIDLTKTSCDVKETGTLLSI